MRDTYMFQTCLKNALFLQSAAIKTTDSFWRRINVDWDALLRLLGFVDSEIARITIGANLYGNTMTGFGRAATRRGLV